MKSFYTDYVNHCLRYYARNPSPTFRSCVERDNWVACDKAFDLLDTRLRPVLMAMYLDKTPVSDNVMRYAKTIGTTPNHIWKVVSNLEKEVAKARGLL